jgi:hypothetical protein
MWDPVQEFQDMPILKQGLMDTVIFDVPKVALQFSFPKHFEIQFNRVEDYRAEMSLSGQESIGEWWASRDSEYLESLPERRRRLGLSLRDGLTQLCHFHMTFDEGYLDVLADDFTFMMVSR